MFRTVVYINLSAMLNVGVAYIRQHLEAMERNDHDTIYDMKNGAWMLIESLSLTKSLI